MQDARASFIAAALCLPIFLLLRAGAGSAADPGRALAADLIAFVCSWAGFALASIPIAEAMGRRALWPRFIAAWNWVNLVQYSVMALLSLPDLLGLTGIIAGAMALSGLGYALWLQWFTTRVALGLPGPKAVAFVALDLGLSVFLSGLAATMAAG
ncbi:hypothetical protein GXW78_15900 [Roseomonas terrae]|uniref:Uncharacterized protein n=1 Tax=Neoroseomonas terrae TaxID=424799 RepID=A0ABS5EJF4_9PROT|nr:hypothetical protein [Neoroseomonas terrae]MBR0651156.1 hypothetical protein [Neoroseomonas terrae]